MYFKTRFILFERSGEVIFVDMWAKNDYFAGKRTFCRISTFSYGGEKEMTFCRFALRSFPRLHCTRCDFRHLSTIKKKIELQSDHCVFPQVEGFDMKHFDDIIMDAIAISDAQVEPQPLWEYPCQALTSPKVVMTFDLTEVIPENDLKQVTSFDVVILKENDLKKSGMAFWMDWHLTETDILTSGPVKPIIIPSHQKNGPKSDIQWNLHSKQGVHFFAADILKRPKNVLDTQKVTTNVFFKPKDANISFSFDLA
jgi:hypothetical protein